MRGFDNFSATETIAAASAFSLSIAISRLIGYFLAIDIKLIALMNMSDVVALSFYASPYVIIPSALAILCTRDKPNKAFNPSDLEASTNKFEIELPPPYKPKPASITILQVLVFIFSIIIFLALGAAYWYWSRLYLIALSVIIPTSIFVTVRIAVIGKYDISKWALYAAFMITTSFSYGLVEGQNAVENPKANYSIEIAGVQEDVQVSRMTHSHIFITNAKNEFLVYPMSEVDRLKILEPQAQRTRKAVSFSLENH